MSFENWTEDHKPKSMDVFLDTSIHCSQHKGSLFKGRIKSILGLFQWKSTSTYTKVEYGNVILARAEFYLKTLRRLRSLEATICWIDHVLRDSGANKAHKQWAGSLLRAESSDDIEATERATLSLQRMMKLGVGFVDAICDAPVQDGTRCHWAAKGVHKRRDGGLEWQTPNCKSCKKKCRVDEFFTENSEVFGRIKTMIDALPPADTSSQLMGFSEVIGEALIDPTCLLNYKTGCRRLADAIIAVESRSFKNFFSQNSAESSVLCQLLNQVFYYLPPNPEKGILIQQPSCEKCQ